VGSLQEVLRSFENFVFYNACRIRMIPQLAWVNGFISGLNMLHINLGQVL